MGGSASPVVLIGAGIVGASALLDLALTLRSGAFVESGTLIVKAHSIRMTWSIPIASIVQVRCGRAHQLFGLVDAVSRKC